MHEVDATLAALADPTRRAVIDLLRTTPRRAGELASMLDVSPPALSRHLRLLRAQGLVQDEAQADDARVRVYCLKPEPFRALRDWLQEVEGFWADQLGSFKQYAEGKRKRTGASAGPSHGQAGTSGGPPRARPGRRP